MTSPSNDPTPAGQAVTDDLTTPSDPRRRFELTRVDVDYALLAVELTAALGRPVAVTACSPADSPDGIGWLILIGADGQALGAEVDGAIVAEVLAAHKPPAPVVDPLDVLGDALASATTVAGLKAALVTYVAGERSRRGVPARPTGRR